MIRRGVLNFVFAKQKQYRPHFVGRCSNFSSPAHNRLRPPKVLELTAEEMDSLDEDELVEAMASIDVLIGELVKSPKDVWNSITASYEDLYLNRCYILAMRARIPKVRSLGLLGGRAEQQS